MTKNNYKKEGELILAFKDSLCENYIELSSDLLEIPIDSITQNEIIKEIPIVGSIVKLGKISIAIRDRYLIKKLLKFIYSVNKNEISKKELHNHYTKLRYNETELNKELELLMLYLERLNNDNKAEVLGNMYLAYINEKLDFDWNDFCIFSEMLDNFSIYDYKSLLEISKKPINNKENVTYNNISLSRLNSLGLIEYFSGMAVRSNNSEYIAQITSIGQLFLDIGFKKEDGTYLRFD